MYNETWGDHYVATQQHFGTEHIGHQLNITNRHIANMYIYVQSRIKYFAIDHEIFTWNLFYYARQTSIDQMKHYISMKGTQ